MKEVFCSKRSLSKREAVHSFRKERSSLRVQFGLGAWFLLALAVLAALAGPGFYSPAGAQSSKPRLQQDIEQVFTNHEDIRLDPREVTQRVKESGRLSLQTQAHDFEINLEPNDLRARDYHAEEVVDGAVVRTVQTPVLNTYKGRVDGMPGTEARFTVDNNTVEGMIITPGESYFLESAQKYSTSAEAKDYLLYKASDVRPDVTKTCGTLDEKVSLGAKQFASSFTSSAAAPEAFSPFKVVEIATEADFEYVSALGGSAAANGDILSIMNQVQGIYERDIGLTFSVVFQHTWATANDPYNATGDAGAALNEFTNYWNANFANTPRDVTHLWTGRSLGGPVGVAWEGVVCRDGMHSYGLSDRETIAVFRVGVPAHEIGHNFNATHCDGVAGCDNTIMVATANQSLNLTFCQFSRDEITNYVNGNSSCLTNSSGSTGGAVNPIDQPDFFVRQQYSDFLNRQADSSGLTYWTNEINSCGADQQCIDSKRLNVSAAFFLSIEFQQTGYLVYRIYKVAYGNIAGAPVPIKFGEFLPDTQTIGQGVVVGQTGWEQVLERNKQAYLDKFVQSSRFTSAYPTSMSPATFVDTLNRNAGSALSSAERTQLVNDLTSGAKTRAQVLRAVAENQNLGNAEFNRAFVLMQYFGYLRRNPNDPPEPTLDYQGYNFWLGKLDQFNGNYVSADMVKAFITSAEYRQRFGK